ncbi:unnamed protein product [Spirodela intermedia]|uniref:Uncharacterized protein n=1 Tax=Spirodela intermedia TaxID=51605 RepID=A0A811G6U8_SPIIN|nr:unnamed protein product [Spirodela intermedia]
MGRSIPSVEPAGGLSHHHRHLLWLALLAASLAATVAVVGLLCGSRHHRSSPSSPPRGRRKPQARAASPSQQSREPIVGDGDGPPPTKPGSRRGLSLSMNLSMKLPEGLSKIRTSRREHQKVAEEEEEASIWTKAIILGDKCKVPEEDDESFVICDEKGNRQKSYRPRTPRSLPVSRANSFSDRDAGAGAAVPAVTGLSSF